MLAIYFRRAAWGYLDCIYHIYIYAHTRRNPAPEIVNKAKNCVCVRALLNGWLHSVSFSVRLSALLASIPFDYWISWVCVCECVWIKQRCHAVNALDIFFGASLMRLTRHAHLFGIRGRLRAYIYITFFKRISMAHLRCIRGRPMSPLYCLPPNLLPTWS